ncbi:unnamed protein product [Cuscuta europaea]|uniref:Uncharacterized protein n=1 Tax=Cuscuta europaea TaxID=41803 RepID=A0A9P0VM67_CUSEU|nr:unnamed protein product [Cuscuta europaea]
MEQNETGCHAPHEGPILCINNCGFFGSAANMNMCSKCYKDMVLKQEQANLAALSFENLVNGTTSGDKERPHAHVASADVLVEAVTVSMPSSLTLCSGESPDLVKAKDGPSRCASCKKRVGLTGFKCRCGGIFCGSHRYSDKHDCLFDYRSAARDAISKANPVIKAEKLDKI